MVIGFVCAVGPPRPHQLSGEDLDSLPAVCRGNVAKRRPRLWTRCEDRGVEASRDRGGLGEEGVERVGGHGEVEATVCPCSWTPLDLGPWGP